MRIIVGSQIKMDNRLFECTGWGGQKEEDLLFFTEKMNNKFVGEEFFRPRSVIMDLISRNVMEVIKFCQ